MMPFEEEAKKIVKLGEEEGVILRIMGAVAYKIHSPTYSYLFDQLDRQLSDLDFASLSVYSSQVISLFDKLGYSLKSGRLMDRKKFVSRSDNRVADVFFDRLEMCHCIEFKNRLLVDYPTISLADLVLEKLQIVKITEKDFKDMAILFLEHEVGENDEETINSKYIAELLSRDWGFYYTATLNLRKLKEKVKEYKDLWDADFSRLNTRIEKLIRTIEQKKKSLRWKIRAKIGTRMKWYTEVEDFKEF